VRSTVELDIRDGAMINGTDDAAWLLALRYVATEAWSGFGNRIRHR